MCFPSCLVQGQLRAHCVTVWPNQKVSTPRQQMQPIKAQHQSETAVTAHHKWSLLHTWAELNVRSVYRLQKKLTSHFGPKERDSHVQAQWRWEGLEAKIPNIPTLPFLIGDAVPPRAAVILISWVSRAEAPLTRCLIICTSPEINFDVKCLWASGSGPRGGQRCLWAKCLPHAAISKRREE